MPMIRLVRQPEFTYPKGNEWKHVMVLQSDKRAAWFDANIVTNNPGNCLPSLKLFQLNYCVVVAT